jgi:hypothetical protein
MTDEWDNEVFKKMANTINQIIKALNTKILSVVQQTG